MNQNVPGDVHVSTISFYATRGVVNITEHVDYVNVTESIIMPGVIAELVVWDTVNLSSILPIVGTEKLVIEFSTPGRESVRYDLIVTSMLDSTVSDNSRTRAYRLIAVSPEMVMNKSLRVCKSYNTNISDMISDIAKNYLKTSKNVNVQQTKGIQKIVMPDVQPFEAIKSLRKRSVAITDNSSSYLFFENRDGFNFKTVESLFTEGSVGDRVFTNDDSLHTDITASEFRNIIAYDQPRQFDIVSRLDGGGIARDIQKFDVSTLEYKTSLKKLDTNSFKNADGNAPKMDNELLAKNYGIRAGKSTWIAHDSSKPDTFISENYASKVQARSLYAQGGITVEVFGDSELTAGRLVELRIVENKTSSEAPVEHSMLSGKYLIGALHHMILPEGNVPRYTCSMELVKGGYKDLQQ